MNEILERIAKSLESIDAELKARNKDREILINQAEQIEKIEQGESPTVRELQEVRRKSKLKDQTIKALEDELERVKQTKTTEKVIEKEIIPQDYQATQDLNKQLLGKNKDLSDELDSVKRSLRLKEASYEMLEKETSEAIALKESIEHLRADKEKLENSVSNIHVDAGKAVQFLRDLSYDDFTPFEIRETPKQKEIIALERG